MLIFSYAGGGQFDGYAQMTSPAEGHRVRSAPTPLFWHALHIAASAHPRPDSFALCHSIVQHLRRTTYITCLHAPVIWLKWPLPLQMATWENNMTMGGTFDLEWRRAYGLRWEDVQHLHNPLNEGKPVKISRDGQELPPDLGHTLLVMIEEGADRENIPPPPVPGMQLHPLAAGLNDSNCDMACCNFQPSCST